MNPVQQAVRMQQARLLGNMSHCTRRKVGALICWPDNVLISDGYNGAPRGGDKLCGGPDTCSRELLQITSNTRTEVGCHHAEQNAILNAGRTGRSCMGGWMFCTDPPCLACARMIHHSGITKVLLPNNAPASDGTLYLKQYGVVIEHLE